ncbi:beta-lactamase-like protein [Novosphingobium sp. Rr 2-17]|uniref:hypothetical protein n=1 Tax=Novosphingobium sp. Rr 2-17 TaxID=555793 RepID=UPI00026994ED|nr:hypothetical protein [Novosphingobium sp. Rr 2-17]EIZ80419.1 beta-lactamase-like protein [Novosphingobium sp. Rr 2-17]
MTRRLNVWLAVLLLVIGAPVYWLLLDSGTGDAAVKPITITQLRTLAGSVPGPLPRELRVETLVNGEAMRNLLYAGGGLRDSPVVVRAFQLVVPGGKPIIIDAGTTPALADDYGFDRFDHAAHRRVQHAVTNAEMVLLQASMPLRNGGLPMGREPARSIRIPRGQGPQVVAPGVVMIPLRGMAPGAALIFARMANGHEYLFAGAVARTSESWREEWLPARYTTRRESSRFRREMASWLMTINALHRQAPQMIIVPGIDPAPIPFAVSGFTSAWAN